MTTLSTRLLPHQRTQTWSQQLFAWPEVLGTRGTVSLSPHHRLKMYSRGLLPCLRPCSRQQMTGPKLWALLRASWVTGTWQRGLRARGLPLLAP